MSKDFLVPAGAVNLGAAWAGSSVNCVPYRVAPMLTNDGVTVVSFYNSDGNIKICSIDADFRITETSEIVTGLAPHDAHVAISMGREPWGRYHLAFGAHASTLFTAVSKTNRLKDGFQSAVPTLPKATYPMFLNLANGTLVLIYREGVHYSGKIRLAKFNTAERRWKPKRTALLNGQSEKWTSGPYVNTPAISKAKGHQVHLFFVWRLPEAATDGGAVINSGVDYLYTDDDFKTLKTATGVALSAPVTPSNAERVIPVALNASMINQASAGCFADGRPVCTTYWADSDGIPQYRLCWQTVNGNWRHQAVSDFVTPFRLDGGGTLPLPHSRPELVVDRDDNIILLYRSSETNSHLVARYLKGPDYLLDDSSTQELVNEDLGFYEPVVDRSEWESNQRLNIFVQRCTQERNSDKNGQFISTEAWLKTWTLVTR